MGNRVGSSTEDSISSSASTTMDIDQVGTSNTLDYDIYGDSANITSNITGNSSDNDIQVGTTDHVGSDDVDITINASGGNSNSQHNCR